MKLAREIVLMYEQPGLSVLQFTLAQADVNVY